MRFRKLRITWSVFWGLACVLLVVLWVRSSFSFDCVGVTRNSVLASARGELTLEYVNAVTGPHAQPGQFESRTLPSISKYWYKNRTWNLYLIYGSHTGKILSSVVVKLPALLVAFGMLAIFPWLRWSKRFSVRTLLIATALVAVILGLAVWAATK